MSGDQSGDQAGNKTVGTMTVSVLAERVGTSSSALRYYERIGLLPEPARSGIQRMVEEPPAADPKPGCDCGGELGHVDRRPGRPLSTRTRSSGGDHRWLTRQVAAAAAAP